MIPYYDLVPMKDYVIDTQYCSFVGTFHQVIYADGRGWIKFKVNGKNMLFFEHDRFMDVEPVNKEAK
jgi:hypothetical protein